MMQNALPENNRVWCLVDLPPNCKTVGNKWLIKKMTDMDNIVHTYKARLVAKGFTQTYEVDYEETFSPVADIRAIRILIAIAAFYDYEIWQMDVKTAFLNGYLNEDIYMVFDLNKTQGASTPEEVKRMQNVPYALAVGSIMYAVRCIRPDVEFTQNITSYFQQNPGKPHWTAFLQNILDLYFKHFKLSEDVVNRILQVVLDLQHFKSSLFIFAATILQSSSAIHHISNIDNFVHQIIKFQSILITSSHSLWSSQSFGHQKAINGFDMPLPVAVCSGLVNPLAPRK
ncbi:putative retrotransposon protein, partial [Tanacetum coccineum]